MPQAAEVNKVVLAIKQLPEVAWPGGYQETGLAVLDAVWSPSSNYENTVRPLVERYREWRPTADLDTAADLMAAIDVAGGPEGFAADVVRNRQRTSTRNGILKAEAVRTAAQVLVEGGVGDRASLLDATAGRLEEVRIAWCGVRGQRSGITFRYLQMLVGIENVKPDRMVRRFLANRIGREPSLDEAVAIVEAAAERIGCRPIEADHRIWSHESTKGRRESALFDQRNACPPTARRAHH